MPTYFFDTQVEGSERVEDDEGIDLPNLESVKREAITSAREQIADAAKQGFDILTVNFECATRAGK